MGARLEIVVAGGGAAGWLTACYLQRALGTAVSLTVVESPEIGIIGVGEGTFPTIRATLGFLGIDEARFLRESCATFKQGIRFDDWMCAPHGVCTPHGGCTQHGTRTPQAGPGGRSHYFHPFEFPQQVEGAEMLPFWLLGAAGPGVDFADAVTIQKRVADASLAPKRTHDGNYRGPLNYAYHFDAFRFAGLLASVAIERGVRHVSDTIESVQLDETGAIAGLVTRANGVLKGALYIDCTGLKAKLIGEALGQPFHSCQNSLLTDRAVTCQVPYGTPDSPIPSYTIATAHEAGWTWDIGLNARRGVGYVYSSAHSTDARAEQVLRSYIGSASDDKPVRVLKFSAGYRECQWARNCVAVGLAAGFFEPLESTGLMLIEVAAAMIAELLPWNTQFESAARLFNQRMANRCSKIVNFLKLHYCLSQRDEPFWRDNRLLPGIPDELQCFLDAWRTRPPTRFDFVNDYETFPHFSYQYVLYGMGFRTDLEAARPRYAALSSAASAGFKQLRRLGQRAVADLPTHRALIERVYREGFSERLPARAVVSGEH